MNLIQHLRSLEAKIYAADTQDANKYAGQLADALYEVWPKLANRIEKLEAALRIAESFLNKDELLMHQYYRIKDGCDDDEMERFNEKDKAWQDALAALEEDK
jgi:hypothetical protein